MNKDILAIFDYMEREKGVKREVVIRAIETALKAAAHKTLDEEANISVQIHPKTGEIEVSCEKEIVEKITGSPYKQILLEEARALDPDCEIGQFIDVPIAPKNFGRIAAQTARQLISQHLRGAERDVIYEEYRHRVNEILTGVVKRVSPEGNVIVDLGRVEALLPARYYPKTEQYAVGDKLHALLHEVQESENGGARVILTRSHPSFVVELFHQEVPELDDGTVIIEKIVRDAGYRTKMLVRSTDNRVDPVGTCVGMRGNRVKNVIREVKEKIDIVPYSEDFVELIQQLFAPVEIRKIAINEEDRVVSLVVDDADFPVVIGKRGMNARLTGSLLDYQVEVQPMTKYNKSMELQRAELAEGEDRPELDAPLQIEDVNKLIVQSLIENGYDTLRKLLLARVDQLIEIPGITLEMSYKILEQAVKMAAKPWQNN